MELNKDTLLRRSKYVTQQSAPLQIGEHFQGGETVFNMKKQRRNDNFSQIYGLP